MLNKDLPKVAQALDKACRFLGVAIYGGIVTNGKGWVLSEDEILVKALEEVMTAQVLVAELRGQQ